MRRSSPCFLVSSTLFLLALIAGSDRQWAVGANFHTEGGNFKLPSESAAIPNKEPQQQQYYDVELNGDDLPNVEQQQRQQPVRDSNLAGIVEQLNEQLRRDSVAYDEPQQQQQQPEGRPTLEELVPEVARAEAQKSGAKSNFRQRQQELNDNAHSEIEELRQLGHKFKELSSQAKQDQEEPKEEAEIPVEKPSTKPHKEEEIVEEDEDVEEKPLSTPQKKGQSEYVEFIEPVHAKKLKNKEYLEKRVASDDERSHHHHSHHYRAFNLLSSSGNVIFIAFVTMCCVFSVVGVIGGMYYYNHMKSSREDPFDDFTRYSPAGPGRDKLGGKKGRGGFGGEQGDDTLAYKAQLHHYQQTKQKIIGEQAAADVDASDKSDDEADLEHNFSVYECPGLAPTGDIEVTNPNFIESPTSGKKAAIVSPH